jgi:hypothetical protein
MWCLTFPTLVSEDQHYEDAEEKQDSDTAYHGASNEAWRWSGGAGR